MTDSLFSCLIENPLQCTVVVNNVEHQVPAQLSVAGALLYLGHRQVRQHSVSGDAGARKILLKSSGLLPKEIILAGSGPLLLLLAQQYRAGRVTIKALLDTTPKANYWRVLPWLVAGLTTPKQLIKGLWLTLAQRIKVPYITGVSDLQITGEHSACGVRYTVAGTVHSIACWGRWWRLCSSATGAYSWPC